MKKFSWLIFMVISALSVRSQEPVPPGMLHFYTGTYTDNGSEGIYRFGLDRQTGKLHSDGLAALSESPSFLALTKDGKYLLAVRETQDEKNGSTGYIELFRVDPSGSLTSVNKVASGGAHPCHVTVDKDGNVLAANYNGGNVALMHIDSAGMLSEVTSLQQHTGSGPVKGRQEKPHVHSSLYETGGKRIFVADLGIDRIKVYNLDKEKRALRPDRFPEIKMVPGSGPRHMVLSADGHFLYVANELSSSASVVQLLKNGSYRLVETVSTLPVGFTQANTCADIHLSPDGKFLYVSNRGMNTIAIFAVSAKDGTIKLVGHESTRGKNPRNFTLTPDGDYLLAANQNSDNIVCFQRNAGTGLLTWTDQINAFRPVCLLFR